MSQDPEAALPPYFGISPDEALAELGPPGRHPRLRRDRRGLRPRPRRPRRPRPRARAARKRLRLLLDLGDHPLPDPGRARRTSAGCCAPTPPCPRAAPRPQGGAKWFTLDEVLRLRAHFAAEGSRAKEYRPWRPAGLPAKVAAVANFKGGVGKTSTAAHLAMSAALDGYRVLVVDLDSQGSMTSIFGGRVADEWDTVFPLIARDYALGLQAENRRRVERGDAAAAARGDARRPRSSKTAAGRDPEDPLAEHRPHRRPAQPLLGRVPDPGLAHGPARLEALGGARATRSTATACSTPTTSSSSTPPRRSAT